MWKDSIKSHRLRLRESAFEMGLQDMEEKEIRSDDVFTKYYDLWRKNAEKSLLVRGIHI